MLLDGFGFTWNSALKWRVGLLGLCVNFFKTPNKVSTCEFYSFGGGYLEARELETPMNPMNGDLWCFYVNL